MTTIKEALEEHRILLLDQLELKRVRIAELAEYAKRYVNTFDSRGYLRETKCLIEEMEVIFSKYEHLQDLKGFLHDKDLYL